MGQAVTEKKGRMAIEDLSRFGITTDNNDNKIFVQRNDNILQLKFLNNHN